MRHHNIALIFISAFYSSFRIHIPSFCNPSRATFLPRTKFWSFLSKDSKSLLWDRRWSATCKEQNWLTITIVCKCTNATFLDTSQFKRKRVMGNSPTSRMTTTPSSTARTSTLVRSIAVSDGRGTAPPAKLAVTQHPFLDSATHESISCSYCGSTPHDGRFCSRCSRTLSSTQETISFQKSSESACYDPVWARRVSASVAS